MEDKNIQTKINLCKNLYKFINFYKDNCKNSVELVIDTLNLFLNSNNNFLYNITYIMDKKDEFFEKISNISKIYNICKEIDKDNPIKTCKSKIQNNDTLNSKFYGVVNYNDNVNSTDKDNKEIKIFLSTEINKLDIVCIFNDFFIITEDNLLSYTENEKEIEEHHKYIDYKTVFGYDDNLLIKIIVTHKESIIIREVFISEASKKETSTINNKIQSTINNIVIELLCNKYKKDKEIK